MFALDEYRALREGAGIVDRSSRAKVAVHGSDRAGWLQGLLTNDVAALRAGEGLYAAHLTPQGRMVTDLRLVETGDRIILDFEGALREAMLTRFDQFIFAEDVRLEDLTDSHALIGVHGPNAAPVLGNVLEAREEGLQSMAEYANAAARFRTADVLVIASRDYGERGFDLLVEVGTAEGLANALREAGAEDVGEGASETARVEAGRPRFGVDMNEETIPLEAGLEERAISLTKGCYVGQEVVIRILHRGHGRVARKLVGLTLTHPNAESYTPTGGDVITAAGREVGQVTSGVLSPALGRPIALGYVQRDLVTPGTEVVIVTAGHQVPAVVTALPFR